MLKKVLAFLLLLAAIPLPYKYYINLRYAVCFSLIYILVSEWKLLTEKNKAACIVIALVFNPFFPIYFTKPIWIIVDVISAIFLLNIKSRDN